MSSVKPATTLNDLEADYKSLEHELFVLKACDRPITMELMDRAMKIAHDILNRVTDAPDPTDFEEIREELKHRIDQIIDEEVK